jgi:hypothetical protein
MISSRPISLPFSRTKATRYPQRLGGKAYGLPKKKSGGSMKFRILFFMLTLVVVIDPGFATTAEGERVRAPEE